MKARDFAREREDARRYFAASVPEWATMVAEDREQALDIHMGIVYQLLEGDPAHDGETPRGFMNVAGA